MRLEFAQLQYSFPTPEVPSWSAKVDRWYQLDAPAYGLAQAFSRQVLPAGHVPSMILLASAGSSSETDFLFAKADVPSPSRFVHTLPSVRAVPLMQVMGWQGPVLCFQNDPFTWLTGIEEALGLCDSTNPEIWIVGARPLDGSNWSAHFARLMHSDNSDPSARLLIEPLKSRKNDPFKTRSTDADFWRWLETDRVPESTFALSSEWDLRQWDAKAP